MSEPFLWMQPAGPAKCSPFLVIFCLNEVSTLVSTLSFYAVLIFIVAIASILLLRYHYKMQLKKEEAHRKAIELELAALRLQMNPHFIFNSLNAIQDFIFQHKTEEANEYLSKFAKLMRAVLQQSRKKSVTIEEECDLLSTYLELESLRFNHSFAWEFEVAETVDIREMTIPSMLLQPVLENSVRHGFKNLARKGFVKITFTKEGDSIYCEITDNGHGRCAEKEQRNGSLSLSIINERLAMLNQSLQQPCTLQVHDLFDEGRPAGLKTVFSFPAASRF